MPESTKALAKEAAAKLSSIPKPYQEAAARKAITYISGLADMAALALPAPKKEDEDNAK